MDSFFAMEQYYSNDESEFKSETELLDDNCNSFEHEACSSQSTSPELKPVRTNTTVSNASSSPRDTQAQWQAKRPRKRHDNIHRPFRCGWDGCEKAYGRLNHLNTHVAIHRHGPRRTGMDFPHASRKRSLRPSMPELQLDHQLPSNVCSSSEGSPKEMPLVDEPFVFSADPEWFPMFQQPCEDATVGAQMPFDRYSFLAVQKTRHEHGRNEALTRVKTLEHERNSLSEELSRLDQQIDRERLAFTREQQSLEQTMDELAQWRYPQHSEAVWCVEN